MRTTWYWIDRNDGTLIEGPFDTVLDADNQLRRCYDQNEHVVARTDYDRRGVAVCEDCGSTDFEHECPAPHITENRSDG